VFDWLKGAVNNAVKTIKNALGGRPAPKPKPAPAPRPKTPTRSPIRQVFNGVASFMQNPFRAVSQQRWLPASVTNWAAVAARQQAQARAAEAARQKKLAEAARQKRQAELNKFRAATNARLKKTAGDALNWLNSKNVKYNGNWRTLFTTDGKYKGYNTGNGFLGGLISTGQKWFDSDVTRAQKDYKKWLSSSKSPEALEQRAKNQYEKIKDEYQDRAEKNVEQLKKSTDDGFFGFNWLHGGNKDASRDFAQKELEKLQKDQTARYDNKLNSFLKEQARKKAAIEKKRFTTRAEFNKAVKGFSKWENSKIKDLEYTRAATEGMMAGFGKKSVEKNDSPFGKVSGWFTESLVPAVTNNGLFKYTLGSGDKNTPSVVTAPSRLINAVGNQFWNDKRNYHGGKTEAGKAKDFGEAWRQSFNQRNLNIGFGEKYTDKGFREWYKTRDLSQWKEDIDSGRVDPKKVENLYRGAYKSQVEGGAAATNVAEFFADPLFLVAGGAKIAGKGTAAGLSWASKTARATKTGAGFFNTLSKAKNSKTFKWLGAEYKTPQQKLGDALTDVKTRQGEIQKKLLPRINEYNRRAGMNKQIDTAILDDLGKLSDHEAKVLQRMADGKFAFRDKLLLRDIRGKQYSAPQREKLMDLYNRWTDFTEKLKLADNVSDATSFGRGKRFYAPNTSWIREKGASLDDYNFRLMKRRKSSLTASDMYQGAVDRYMVSNMQNWHRAGEMSRKTSAGGEAARLQRMYNQEMKQARLNAGLDEAFENTKGIVERVRNKNAKGFVRRNFKFRGSKTAIGNTARGIYGAPISLWKKSVLKYRPAWTVNNVLYNTQAGVLAGGTRSLVEQARLLRPKNWRQAMDEVPAGVKADLTGELGGKGKLNRFYNNVENWSRVSAFRASKSKGLTDAQALKRVDKYLYNYKTKNWERPIKSILPFWAWNKNLARASVQMPFDRPLGAKIYNSVDRYQNNQFDAEFEKVVPELTKLGYTEQEIEKIKSDQAKYYRGRLKVGDKWVTTPFNAFSEKGLAGFGINPYIAAAGESATSKDSFGREIGGTDSLFRNRLLSKFPQADLVKKGVDAWRVNAGFDRPRRGWIGAPGSSGYGLTKEAQGYDKSKGNYVRSMDPRAKVGQNAAAFFGVPRGLEFNKDDLIKRKQLQKVTDAYFKLDTDKMDFKTAEKAREAIFKKYGIKADDFYKGLLAKYDTDNTKRIKGLKEDARAANKKLFDEYAAQPKGTRNLWATKKLRELNASGYFGDNPFKKSFDWVDPESVGRADRQDLYEKSKASGDWSAWRGKYGTTANMQKREDYLAAKASGDWSGYERKYGKQFGRSEKAIAVQYALKTGDWSSYRDKYGVSREHSPYEFDGKYFKSAESMAKYKEGAFWRKYADASKEDRRVLLEKNPEYNHREDWTTDQWDDWKKERDAKLRKEARQYKNFAFLEARNMKTNTAGAAPVLATQSRSKSKRLIWKT